MNSFKKFLAAVGAFVLSTFSMQSQKYMYVYKDGAVVAKHEVASVDSVSIVEVNNGQRLSVFKGEVHVGGYNVEEVDSLSFEPKISISQTELKLMDTDEPVSLGFVCFPSEDISSADVLWTSSDNSVATVKDGIVSSVNEGECVIKGMYGSQTVVCNVTVIHNPNAVNGYEYVDLGLESGTLWATCNIGATKPEEYGYYFAWGETDIDTIYNSGKSKAYGVNYTVLETQGIINEKGNLTSKYDAATVNYGEEWRMPTNEEIKELLSLKSENVEMNGVKGRKFIGTNGNTLFFPFGGYPKGGSLYETGENCYFWSSTAVSGSSYKSMDCKVNSKEVIRDETHRDIRRSVRAVKKLNDYPQSQDKFLL